MLVFDGGEVVEVANNQPPLKTSTHLLIFNGGSGVANNLKQVATIENQHTGARFRWRRGGGGGKPAATIENEHTRVLVFDGGEVVEVANQQPPSKTSIHVLVFDGGEVVEVANQQPPSKMSIHVLIFHGGGGGGGKQATTIKKEHVRARF